MYRQPENSNRVKSMKSKFEGLDTTNNDKPKKAVRNNISAKPLHISEKTLTEKQKQKIESNNNITSKKSPTKINSNKMKTNDNKTRTEKFADKNSDKNIFDVNKKELCNVPPLNLTRQLNDPTKKGCIKRTPAFRKDKLNNNRTKTNEDMNFASIVKLFEGNNDVEVCDTDNTNNPKILTRSISSDDNPIKNTNHKQKLTSSLSNVTKIENISVISKNSSKNFNISTNTALENTTSTLKMSDKENEENSVKIPAYAEVIKPKKHTTNFEAGLTDTLKAALKQPLPKGPPPKKPPRTFAHTSKPLESQNNEHNLTNIDNAFCERLNENLAQKITKPPKIKSDPKLMLEKLENALLSNKIRSPKLPKKLKSLETTVTSQNVTSNTQPNLYTAESPHKTIFPNCLSLNCISKTSNSYAKIAPKSGTMSTFFTDCQPGKAEEPIYAEPYVFKTKEDSPKSSKIGFFRHNTQDEKADTLSNSLHYMSNPVWNEKNQPVLLQEREATKEKNIGNNGENALLTRQQLNLIMNRTYATPSPSDSLSDIDSLPSTPSSDETPQSSKLNTIKDLILSFEQKHHLEPASLNQSSFVKEKLTVSSSWPVVMHTNKRESDKQVNDGDVSVEDKKKFKTQLNRTLTEIRKTYVKRVSSTLKRKTKAKNEISHLFECCLLVGLNVSDSTPYIKNKFPPDYEVPPWVEHLCFPDATEWSDKIFSATAKSQDCQCYSLVITNEKGDRKFGYCRRVVPEETSVCLPLTYCIISSCRAAGFYDKVLRELESRHGLPFGLQEAFVRELYNCKFPQPGETIKVSCLLRTLVVNSCEEMVKNKQITTPENVECVKRLVNMQSGVYGSLNKVNMSDNNRISEEWMIVEETKDFRIPKNTYGGPSEPKSDIMTDSFSKIKKLANDSRRCISISNESLDSIDNLDILRTKQNTSYIHRNQNSRSSEPQINKRIGQVFENLNLSDNKTENSELDVTNYEVKNAASSSLLHLPNSQLLHDCFLGDILLKRPHDIRLEDVDLTALFNTLDLGTLIQTFGSLLHERKVVFVSSSLSKLSSCIEALQSMLYPFSWQHTFIPVLSKNMLDILSAPLPLIAGVLSAHVTETLVIEEGIAVNLDTSSVVCYMGDENEIIPKRLQKGLSTSLQLVTDATDSDDRSRNVLVSEAFIRLFVEVCGCYKQFIYINDSGQRVFERESFIKHHSPKCVKWFLEWFSETAMFNHFIQSHLDGDATDSIFELRCLETNLEKNPTLKTSKVTQKMKHLGHKLFH